MTRKNPARFVQRSLFDENPAETRPAPSPEATEAAEIPREPAPEAPPPADPWPLPDRVARERATTATGVSLLVEASAGTGKTKTLIDRLLHLALEDGIPLSEIAALTFTEKAAGEMKERLREALEKEASGTGPRAARARTSREALAAAEIGTLHAFCARLLSERPVEAGLPPGFAPPDETVSRELFRESFDLWVHDEARKGASPLAAALRGGARLESVRTFAAELFSQRFLLASAELPQSPLEEFRRETRLLVADVEDVVLNSGESFRKSSGFPSVLADLKRLLALPFDDAVRFEPRAELKKLTGKKALSEELEERADSARKRWKALPERLLRLRKEPILLDLVASLRDGLFAAIEERKAREGLLDFDDLLLHARRLLRSSPHVREHFRRRFRTLVVDEFQDTDPVQVEIVLRLAAGEPQEADFTRLVPRPGALFLVGDPKQSIYRFRRADVETYTRVAGLFPQENRLSLVASFRSTPAVIDTVNTLFARVLTGTAPWEAPFASLAAGRPHEDAGPRPVFLLPQNPGTPRKDDDEEDETPAREAEANAIVNFLLARKGTLFTRFSEVAILVLRNDRAVEMEEALLAAGIPARLEGGKSYWQREETHAVLAALDAIDDAGDSVALATALKSFLFGHTDLDLLEAREAGYRFGEDDGAPAPSSPLAASLDLLSRLARERHRRPLVATLLDLLDSCDAFLSLRNGAVANGVQGAANLERLVLLARDMDVAGLSFGAARRRLAERVALSGPEPRAAVASEDAVRVLTIHKAKGLEFEVAVVADLALAPAVKSVPGVAFVADRPGGSWGSALTMGGLRVMTPGYARLKEAHEERERAEARRLLYVAMTRARRGLVLSFFRRLVLKKNGEVSDPLARNVLGSLEWALAEGTGGLVESVTGDTSRPQRHVLESTGAAGPAAARFDIDAELEGVARRAALLETLRARRLLRAGEKADRPRSEELPEDQPAPDRTRPATRALEVGIGVHGAMERLLREGAPRTDASALDGALRGAAPELSAEGLAEARVLVERLLADPVVPRAFAAKRLFTEL
ncbi:MAG: UvrD-helicase domain-containing protein, partial [Acidobacteria bacterium]|nr:UvrD-helicase domain-containing protein [Acidobacteriota bacterium]